MRVAQPIGQPQSAQPTVKRGVLRFITCGSVDDGKSTLIGRLLYDSKQVADDVVEALRADSRRFGTTGKDTLDFALLVDGLQAEREQGITIDVAYRYFATPRRSFIVADTPGHEQYTRNMVTGASTADLALVLIDARKGVQAQTRRHAHIASLLGIRRIVAVVNKMDLVGQSQATYDAVAAEFGALCARLSVKDATCIPLSALSGDNVAAPSTAMPWYSGPALLPYLEEIDVAPRQAHGLRLPVQWVNRPDHNFRGYAGTLSAGRVAVGDLVVVLPSGHEARVQRIVTADGDIATAERGQAVTLTLDREIDISRGDLLAAPADRPEVADQFAAHVVWMSEKPLMPGRSYFLRLGTATVGAHVTRIKHKVSTATFEYLAADHLDLNDIGSCNLSLDRPLAFDPYKSLPELGGFIFIDRLTNATVGCGMIEFPLRRALNVHMQAVKVTKKARAAIKGQRPCVLWFTGLSGAGKSTIADLVEQRLHAVGCHTFLIDGDNLRHGLSRDLGFTTEDRVENVRRAAECAKLMVEAGLICITALISPFTSDRAMARSMVEAGEFLEIFVATPLDVCETRDSKGLYKRARLGEIPNFTGISSPYEPPSDAEMVLGGDTQTPDVLAERVVAMLIARGVVSV
jgi:bifunctional enzyme CysN/CysC